MKPIFQRTPKNYDGPRRTSKEIKELLPDLLQKIGSNFEGRGDLIIAAWPSIVGERISSMTKALSFQEGILHVNVKNSTLYSLLNQYEKPKLLKALRDKFPTTNIKNIYFRIG